MTTQRKLTAAQLMRRHCISLHLVNVLTIKFIAENYDDGVRLADTICRIVWRVNRHRGYIRMVYPMFTKWCPKYQGFQSDRFYL